MYTRAYHMEFTLTHRMEDDARDAVDGFSVMLKIRGYHLRRGTEADKSADEATSIFGSTPRATKKSTSRPTSSSLTAFKFISIFGGGGGGGEELEDDGGGGGGEEELLLLGGGGEEGEAEEDDGEPPASLPLARMSCISLS